MTKTPENTQEQILELTYTAGTALKQAEALADQVDAEKQAAARLVPDRVTQLLDSRLIEEGERQFAFEKLSTHDGALEVLGNVLPLLRQAQSELRQKTASAGPGRPVPDPQAVPAAPVYFGGTRGSSLGPRASDQQFLQRMLPGLRRA